MRSTLGLPTGGSGKSSTTCISTRSLWICYFRNLIVSQQFGFAGGGGTSPSRASCHRCFSSSTRFSTSRTTLQQWRSIDLDHHISSIIQPSDMHQKFRPRSKIHLKSTGNPSSTRIKSSPSTLNNITTTRHASSTSFDSINQQSLSPMEPISDDHPFSTTSSASPDRQHASLLHPRWFNTENDIDHVLQQLKAHREELDKPFIFKSLRSMLYNVSQYKSAMVWKIYEAMQEHNVTPYLRSNHYGHLLNIIKYTPNATPKLLEILDHMKAAQQQGQIVIGDRHYSQILFGMSRQGDVVAICDLLRILAQSSSSHGLLQSTWYTSLALAAKRNGNLKHSKAAAEIMAHALKQGVKMERRACAVMVSALSIDRKSTVKFMTTMKETGMMTMDDSSNNNNNNNENDTRNNDNGNMEATMETAKFNVHIYTSLISGLAHNGDENTARRLWKVMHENGLKPTTVTYAALVEAYGRSGNVPAAVDLMKKYTFDNKGQMNKVMATSVLTNCIRHGKLDTARNLLSYWINSMDLTTDSKMDNEFWSAVMWLKVTENVAHARDFYESLYRQHPDYVDSVMVNHLVKGYGKAQQKQHVLDSFELHKTTTTSSIHSQIDPRHFLVDSLFKCRDVPAALTALVMMRQHSTPDDITMAMVIRGLVMNNEDDVAWKLFQTLKSNEMEPNLHAYSSILKTCIKKAKRGAKKQQSTSQQHQQISMDIIQASLKISNTAKSSSSSSTGLLGHKTMAPEQAYILFRKMTGYQKPNVYTYTTLIACFAKHNIGRAVNIFTHMCADGVEPVMETYVALLQGCAIFRNAHMALLVFNHMQEKQHLTPNDKVWHYLLKALVRNRTKKKEIDRLGTMVRALRQKQKQGQGQEKGDTS